MRRKLATLKAVVDELQAVIVLAMGNKIEKVECEHVGQMDRAVTYSLDYVASARKSVLRAIHKPDTDSSAAEE